MSAIRWLSDISGYFDNAADWKGGVVPGASDGAVLKAAGSPFTVTSNADETVKSVELGRNATLDITNGTFEALTGTGRGANAGNIIVGAGAVFEAAGTVKNTGGITLQGAAHSSANFLLDSSTTLSAAGTVTLGSAASSVNYQTINATAGQGTITLTNISNTISGAGQVIGYTNATQNLVMDNEVGGVIGGSGNGVQHLLDFESPFGRRGTIINDGTIVADRGNSIMLYNNTVSGSGTIFTAQGSGQAPTYISILDCTISGQTLKTENRYGEISIHYSSITGGGTIDNAGDISIVSSSLTLDENLTLTGGGFLGVGPESHNAPRSVISGTTASISLTNLNNTIGMSGLLGNGELTLINDSAGTIVASGAQLTIDTKRKTIDNAGVIEITGGGSKNTIELIKSSIDNTGVIAATAELGQGTLPLGNTLTLEGAVTGSGQVTMAGGTLDFSSSFNQNVTFTSTIGSLDLAQSQSYTAIIAGFSTSGGTSLDLRDIGFVATNEANFSGTSASGVLTISDGIHSAHINLNGDYLGATFICASDSKGGVFITASSNDHPAISLSNRPHALVSAMASVLVPVEGITNTLAPHIWRYVPLAIAAPRGQLA